MKTWIAVLLTGLFLIPVDMKTMTGILLAGLFSLASVVPVIGQSTPETEGDVEAQHAAPAQASQSSNHNVQPTDLNHFDRLKHPFQHDIGQVRLVALLSPN